MKKIVAYIGSRKGKNSNTYKFTEAILNASQSKDKDIDFEIVTANDFVIKPCIGCENCFLNGTCVLDKTDEAGKLKEKLLAADMVIFSSPVYAHNVSGDMKVFIDRISYWLHNMKFNRKYAAVISTTDTNGQFTAISYLEKVMCFLGTKLVFKINCTMFDEDEFKNETWVKNKIKETSDKIVSALSSPIVSDGVLETVFQTLKTKYETMREHHHIIDNFKECVDIGLCTSKTYQDFLDNYYDHLRMAKGAKNEDF